MYPTAFRSTLLLGAALAAITPAAVFAQDKILADDTTTAPEEQNSNDIIVTARRRSESAQDIPLAVTVIGGPQIAETGAFNVGRLQQLAPTLLFTSSNPRNTTLNIRGLGVPFGLTSDGFEQGVGLYIDDVYYSRVASAAFDFLDVAQIEVLRGPQGTLYGKNTAAGAVSITTNRPTFDFEGSAEVSLGNYEFKQARVAVSGPLSDTIAVRIAASATDRRGTIRNVTSGQDIQSLDNLGLRAQVLWQPTPDLKITLAGDYNRQNANCCGSVFVRTVSTQRPLNRQFAALAAAQNYAPPSTNAFDRLSDPDSTLNSGNAVGGAALRIYWDVAPGKRPTSRAICWGRAANSTLAMMAATDRISRPTHRLRPPLGLTATACPTSGSASAATMGLPSSAGCGMHLTRTISNSFSSRPATPG